MAKFIVKLTDEERALLQHMVSSGKTAARKLRNAQILLRADASLGAGCTDEEIVEALDVSLSTIHRVRQRFVEENFEAAWQPRPQPRRPDKVKIAAEQEKQLIALACSEPPQGCGRWTLHLLADRLVELACVDSVSHETVRRALKKTTSTSAK